jgi:hypothetical protein
VRVDFFAMSFNHFHQFLIVKLYDRVQELSREQCSGCQHKYRFDILHPCITTPLDVRIYKFFNSAIAEALSNFGKLFIAYQEAHTLSEEPNAYLKDGANFIQSLHPDQLLDRKYINEETESVFSFDSRWATHEVSTLAQTPTIETPDSPKIAKITKKKAKIAKKDTQPTQPKPLEDIVDTPKRQRITKKRKSIYKAPCDDPACCKDQQ